MKKHILKSALIALAGVGLMAGGAMAAPITGTFSMNGAYSPEKGGVYSPLNTATEINFTTNTMLWTAGTLDFAPYTTASSGTIKDFTFYPNLSPNPISDFWVFDNFSFKLTSMSYFQGLIPDTTIPYLFLSGSGIISKTGYDDTFGTWDASFQSTTGTAEFSWSGSTATAVPEPTTMLLFGTGIVGLAGIARRRKTN